MHCGRDTLSWGHYLMGLHRGRAARVCSSTLLHRKSTLLRHKVVFFKKIFISVHLHTYTHACCFLNIYFVYFKNYVCICIWLCIRIQVPIKIRKAPFPLELRLQVVETWVIGTELGFPARAGNTLYLFSIS